ncbi:MAG: hypothetical protein ACREEM_15170 [Blastocatellia bacterium]
MSANPTTGKVGAGSSQALETEDGDYSALLASFSELAGMLESLHQQAVRQCTPVVNHILKSRSLDIQHIEHTLDTLLDHCGCEPGLLLYKKLCRYYFEIDPVATVEYINIYREIWESEPEEEQS